MTIRHVPPAMLERIWIAICRQDKDSGRVKRVFATTGVVPGCFMSREFAHLRKTLPMSSIYASAITPTCCWLATLSLSTESLRHFARFPLLAEMSTYLCALEVPSPDVLRKHGWQTGKG